MEFVKCVRRKDPGMGIRKLWYMYNKSHTGKAFIGRDKFAGIISACGLNLRKPRRHPRTTDSRHHLAKYPNKIKDLIPIRHNQVWVSDITYQAIWPAEGPDVYDFVYISLVTDAYSKEILGWSVGPTLEAVYPIAALHMAIDSSGKENIKDLIHHSDRGLQYASIEYVAILREYGIAISMTENGNPKDNPIAERSNETLKDELLKGMVFRSLKEVRAALSIVIPFYNRERPHMSLNGMTPQEVSGMQGEIPKQWKSYREIAIKKLHLEQKVVTLPTVTQYPFLP